MKKSIHKQVKGVQNHLDDVHDEVFTLQDQVRIIDKGFSLVFIMSALALAGVVVVYTRLPKAVAAAV